MPSYARPTRIDDALKLLARGAPTVLAGGTDHYATRVGKALDEDVLDVTALAELRGIAKKAAHWRIGATTPWTELIEAKLPPLFDGLKLAAREIGGRQIQNSGTLAGNLCNASPAADGVPPLLALDASVELASIDGIRTLPLAQFIVGPRKTLRAPNEIVTAIVVPEAAPTAKGGFLKLGARKYQVISIAIAAGVIEHQAGVVREARIAVGACSPVAMRLAGLERRLAGKRFDADLAECIEPKDLAALAPIDDLRGSAAYRSEAVQILLRRLLAQMA